MRAMMRQYELVERVTRYNPDADEALLDRAYVYAMRAHGKQVRASGDPYFSHPLEVAAILTELKVDDATIVAALLHDTIEDTPATKEEIESLFGHQIAELVDGLTKLKRLDLVSKQAVQAENLRKLFLAIAADVRVLLVKLADRLHNMRTLHYVPPAKRQRIAEETLEIYAPLAGRMGMQDMRDELEDISFQVINPEAHAALAHRLEQDRKERQQAIVQIEKELTQKLADAGVVAEIKGREKRPYSIWSKMERKSVSFEQLSDIVGFRVVVPTVEDCYRAVGIIHTNWRTVPLRFKDYISNPKQNDYRSIHTTVIGPKRERVEMQIRTRSMNDIAEYGIAAHSLYKDGAALSTFEKESAAYRWLRNTVELLSSGDPEEFLEHTKLELFQDQVYCFTPKGKLISLPRKATPIDFAYAVHTDIGNTTIGARINGVDKPLVTKLENGDEVEILTDAQAMPSPAWESVVVTGRARQAVRRATRAAIRAQFSGLGRQLVEAAFLRAGQPYSDDALKAVLKRLARSTVDDVFWAVGRDELRADDIVRAVYPDWNAERVSGPKPTSDWFAVEGADAVKFQVPPHENAIPIRGINADLPVHFAPNSGAVPGDRIVGILTPGEGITIYPIQSPALGAFDNEPERWLDVRWDPNGKPTRYPARVQIKSRNMPGSLAQVAQIIADNDGNIDNLKMTRRTADFTDLTVDIEVWDLKHLNAIIAGLREKTVVADAQRVTE